jgi:hypothetical protein
MKQRLGVLATRGDTSCSGYTRYAHGELLGWAAGPCHFAPSRTNQLRRNSPSRPHLTVDSIVCQNCNGNGLVPPSVAGCEFFGQMLGHLRLLMDRRNPPIELGCQVK